MDIKVTDIMALLIPCKTLKAINIPALKDIPQIIDARVKNDIPYRRSLFRPKISANLPNGKIKTAIDKKKDNTTQFSKTVFIANSLPIEGKAILTDDTINGTINAPKVATNNTIFLFSLSSIKYSSSLTFFSIDIIFS